jgi:two-component system sensor histidine kinase YesM
MLATVCTAILLITSLLFSAAISKDFRKLIRLVDKFGIESCELREYINRHDEAGKLYHMLCDMAQRVREQKMREDQAHIKAYQAQISPHFLYNTLDTVNWLLIEHDEYEISNLVINLGDLLRYSINNARITVTVREEIEQVNNYLMIQHVRFGERLSYTFEIDSSITELMMLKLVLQPIVENAVVHGLENRACSGRLTVRGYLNGADCLVFEVEDNGGAISEKSLADLRAMLDCADNQFSARHGLINIHRWIRLCYSPRYGVSIDSVHGQYTKVAIKLPVIPNQSRGGLIP